MRFDIDPLNTALRLGAKLRQLPVDTKIRFEKSGCILVGVVVHSYYGSVWADRISRIATVKVGRYSFYLHSSEAVEVVSLPDGWVGSPMVLLD